MTLSDDGIKVGCVQHDCDECLARSKAQAAHQPARDERNAMAAQTLLRACADELPKAQRDGRLRAWATMAHSIVDLLSYREDAAPAPDRGGEG